jgi:hypothetical protein
LGLENFTFEYLYVHRKKSPAHLRKEGFDNRKKYGKLNMFLMGMLNNRAA